MGDPARPRQLEREQRQHVARRWDHRARGIPGLLDDAFQVESDELGDREQQPSDSRLEAPRQRLEVERPGAGKGLAPAA